MERQYIRIKRPSLPFPKNTDHLRSLDDEFWKNWVFYYLLDFYENYDRAELKHKIEEERKKQYPRIEIEIAKFIRLKLKANREFGLNFSVKGEETNDENVEGNYDITIHNTYWKNQDFYFECKNLDGSQDLTNKYVSYNTYKKDESGHNIFDGGILRYFNGKYALSLSFGGMIGFILAGDSNMIKNSLVIKLNEKFNIAPEGNLITIIDNSIFGNNCTFDSQHLRLGKEFMIHHLLFNFTK